MISFKLNTKSELKMVVYRLFRMVKYPICHINFCWQWWDIQYKKANILNPDLQHFRPRRMSYLWQGNVEKQYSETHQSQTHPSWKSWMSILWENIQDILLYERSSQTSSWIWQNTGFWSTSIVLTLLCNKEIIQKI